MCPQSGIITILVIMSILIVPGPAYTYYNVVRHILGFRMQTVDFEIEGGVVYSKMDIPSSNENPRTPYLDNIETDYNETSDEDRIIVNSKKDQKKK